MFLTILGFAYINQVHSQVSIKGQVVNTYDEPAIFINVYIENLSSQIIKTTTTNENGRFFISKIPSGNYKINFTGIGYKKKSKIIFLEKINEEFSLVIRLEDEVINLNEVIIHAERPISIKKDTINFKTKFFINGTEQTVEDLLQKIPGLQIDNNGTIKVGNQEIEKLMVDGDDLFERGYKILSKNMPAYPIEEVEILKNYSNNRLLNGVEESDKVTLKP